MQLDAVTAEIRPRSDWEAADLGLALTRKHLGAIMKLWMLLVIPTMLLIAIPLWNFYPGIALFVIWWLKPVFARVPLFYLSRVLFGEKPTKRSIAKAYPKMWIRRFFWRMLIARFSPYRSFVMPVEELEDLKGKKFRKRASLLGRYGSSTSLSVFAMFHMLEYVCVFALGFLYIMFLPEVQRMNFEGVFAEIGGVQGAGLPIEITQISLAVYILTITLIEPFYVGAGFGLYINSRTITEGWDIELAFKRLKERLQDEGGKVAKIALLFFLCGIPSLANLKAEPVQDVASPAEAIKEVLDGSNSAGERLGEVFKSEDFKIHDLTIKVTESKPSKKSSKWWDFGDVPFISQLIVFLLWFAGAAIVAFLIYQIVKNFPSMRMRSGIQPVFEKRKVTTVMGMEITKESLPKDILAAAKQAWSEGDSRKALSLLYRGAIFDLIEKDQVPIAEGDTEADCLRKIQLSGESLQSKYFADLTNVWLRQAYAYNRPSDGAWNTLCSSWPFDSVLATSEEKKGG